MLFLLSACQNDTPTPSTYDPRGLVTEECAHLDNIDDWQPVWCDEFDEDGLPDSSKWSYDVGGHGWGNQELQYYTNANLNNAFIEDGILNIRAIREDFMGSSYTSARLVTKYKGDWEYARIQVSARMPEGLGTWPAIWMLPTEWRYGDWPHSGEIDIMEHVGYDQGVVHGTIHTGAYNHGLNTQIGYTKNIPTVSSEFHLYEMIWEPARIVLLIDGVQFAQFGYNPESNLYTENSEAWPFDQPFHLILNVAVGGTWGGLRGVNPEAFPTAMKVEYVRVFEKDYAGLDEEPPSEVGDLRVHYTTHNMARLAWNHATDDVKVHYYNVYVDGVLTETTTLNAINIRGLDPDTAYQISVEAVDFKEQSSPQETLTISTQAVRTVNERIQAEDFDAASGVDIEPTEDIGGGYNVGWIDTNDTMEYLLSVEEAGEYVITYRASSLEGNAEIDLLTRSRFPLVTTSIDATGDWQAFENFTSEPFTLTEGVNTFRIRAKVGGFNLNYFDFEKVD